MQPWSSKCVLSLVTAVGLVSTSLAARFGSPYYELQKKHAAEWAKEDNPNSDDILYSIIPACKDTKGDEG